MTRATCLFFAIALVYGQTIPKFEDFRIAIQWTGPNAPVKLVRPDERMFRTQLSNGAKEGPNFAGHYRFVGWGCGSVCGAAPLSTSRPAMCTRRPEDAMKRDGSDGFSPVGLWTAFSSNSALTVA